MSATGDRLNGLLGLRRAKVSVLRLSRPDSGVQSVLLYGAHGSGKNALADTLAQAWLCTQVTEEGACGECQSCAAFGRNRHADLLFVEPQPPSYLIRLGAVSPGETEDRASIQEFFRTLPLMGRNKVVIMRDADRMNADAANAFLKTLEEPPQRCRIVLTTSAPGSMLPTILSRCLAIACELPEPSDLASEDRLESIFSEGAPGRVERVRTARRAYEIVDDLARRLETPSFSEVLGYSDILRQAAEAFDKALSLGARASQAEALAALALALRNRGRVSAVDATLEAHRRVLGNASAGIAFDALFAQLAEEAAKTSK